MLAFQAPPAAVTAPVTQKGKIAGMMRVFHKRQPRRPNIRAASFKSVGIAIEPAMTLKRMYHCVPSAMRKMLPQLIEIRVAMKKATIHGKVMLTGKEAAICASGWAMRATLGVEPIQKPMGVQNSVAATVTAATRNRV